MRARGAPSATCIKVHLHRAGHVRGAGLVEAGSHKRRDDDEPAVDTGRRVERKRQPPNEVRAIRRGRVASRDIHGDRVVHGARATEDLDEATVCLDCSHFVRRDRRLGTLVGSTAVDE